MKEFMFFIRKQANSKHALPPDQHQQFLKGCERYIGKLKSEGKLISAQPIVWDGSIVTRNGGVWGDAPISQSGEIIGGYYHILAADLAEAMAIAKENPEFQFN